jgi:hypothetical protein
MADKQPTADARRKPSPRVLAVIGIVHLAVTTLTWRDLRNRPADQVRGNKLMWRLLSGANTTGSAAYWLFGRKR